LLGSADAELTVVLACRSVVAADAAAAALVAAARCSAARVVVLREPCDLVDAVSVRVYAAALTAWLAESTAGSAEPRTIAALVNNAGTNGGMHAKTFAQKHSLT
jgi:hypothetical protein